MLGKMKRMGAIPIRFIFPGSLFPFRFNGMEKGLGL
jgi:hypothetical protein